MKTLILCMEGNPSWAAMAQAFLLKLDSKLEVHAAGLQHDCLNDPLAAEVMNEIGMELNVLSYIQEFEGMDVDYLITICHGTKRKPSQNPVQAIHKIYLTFEVQKTNFSDSDQILTMYRDMRDEIKNEFEYFYQRILMPAYQKQSNI